MNYQVVLATYNGESHLNPQIESILKQLGNGELLIHDDGSSDGTPALLEKWARRDPRVRVLDGPPQGGASANFSYLLEHTTAPYVFCADQDDIWVPGRVENLLNLMRFYEGVYSPETPLLVHSDLTLIDGAGEEIAPSMWAYQKLDPRWGDQLNLLLTQNVVTGCAMLVNRALLERALPVPREATMHDHWLALVACAQGKVVWTDQPSLLYRQHGKNVVGAKQFNLSFLLGQLRDLLRSSPKAAAYTTPSGLGFSEAEHRLYLTAAALAQRFPQSVAASQARAFAALEHQSLARRPWSVLRGRFLMAGWLRSVIWAFKPQMHLMRLMRLMRRLQGRQ